MLNDKSINSAGSFRGVAFEEIEHTADRALRIYGSDLQELLLNAAGGINSLLDIEYNASSRLEEKSVEHITEVLYK